MTAYFTPASFFFSLARVAAASNSPPEVNTITSAASTKAKPRWAAIILPERYSPREAKYSVLPYLYMPSFTSSRQASISKSGRRSSAMVIKRSRIFSKDESKLPSISSLWKHS